MNTTSRFSVTIGIPAHNEEHNISALLQDILRQKTRHCEISRIVVISDASTDHTARIVASMKDSRITIMKNPTRQGQAYSQNRIFTASRTDAVILFNADIRISDPRCIETIVAPIRKGQADLTSCRITAVPPSTWFESILYDSTLLKQSLYESYENGNNLYTCHGRARAFSKKLFQSMRFQQSVGEDAFSYLFCKDHGMRYQYVHNTQILYQLPRNFADHKKQSIRFLQSEGSLESTFSSSFVRREYDLPKDLKISHTLSHLVRHPWTGIGYVLLYALMNISSYWTDHRSNTWDISKSSKTVSLSS